MLVGPALLTGAFCLIDFPVGNVSLYCFPMMHPSHRLSVFCEWQSIHHAFPMQQIQTFKIEMNKSQIP